MNKNYLLLIAALLMAASFTLAGCGGSDSGGGLFFFIPPKTGLPATKTVYFAANDGYTGVEPWRTNGTAAGTAIVNNIAAEPGTATAAPADSASSFFYAQEAGGKAFFSADPGTGVILYAAGASGAATPVYAGPSGTTTISDPGYISVNDTMYVTDASGLGFVNSDGRVYPIYDGPGGSVQSETRAVTSVGSTVYVVDATGGVGFINTDDMVYPIYNGPAGSIQANATVMGYMMSAGGTVYYNDPSGLSFINSDGMAYPVYEGPAGTTPAGASSMKVAGSRVYLINLSDTGIGFINTDGMVYPVYEDDGSTQATGMFMVAAGSRLYFQDETEGLAYVNTTGEARIVEEADTAGPLDETSICGLSHVGSRVVFCYDDGTHGKEPWIVNTTGEARMLMDINDMTGGSSLNMLMPLIGDIIAETDNAILFKADTPEYGVELWRTDGTKAGTALVKDINARSHFSSPATAEFTEFEGGGLFKANGGERYGNELFFTDGTVAGTVMLKDIYPGPDSSNPGSFISAGANVFFSADTAAASGLLAMSNGTEAGTVFITNAADGSDIYMADVMATDYDAVDNTLYFTWDGKVFYVDTAAMEAIEIQDAADFSIDATDIGKLGMAVYISTGSKLYYVSGSMIAFEVGTDLAVVDVAAIGNMVYFSTAGELYTIDSEAAPGTESDITNSTTGDPIAGADDLFAANGKLFFFADSFKSANKGMFYVDASGEAREFLVSGTTTLQPTADPDKLFLASDGTLYVMGLNNQNLYRVDTNAGDPLALSGFDLGATSYTLVPSSIMESGGTVYLVDSDGSLFYHHGGGVLPRIGAFGSSNGAQNLMDVGGTLYLTDGTSDLWTAAPGSTPGDLGTSSAIEDDNASPAAITDFNASNAVVANGTLFFSHVDADAGNEVHVVSGGNTNATLIDINTNININSGHSAPGNFYDGSDAALFSARDGDHGVEFWVSDGTPGGTMMVKDLNTDTYDAF